MDYSTAPANQIDLRIGQRVRTRRMELGLSQDSLARVLGVTFQQVQKYEKGVNRISAARLFTIAESLGAPVSYFFEDVATTLGHGVSETERTNYVADTLATPEGLQLVMLFHAIKSPRVRRRVVELVRALAEDDGAEAAVQEDFEA